MHQYTAGRLSTLSVVRIRAYLNRLISGQLSRLPDIGDGAEGR